MVPTGIIQAAISSKDLNRIKELLEKFNTLEENHSGLAK